MPLPIVSIHRHVNGYEVREDFRFHSGASPFVYVCQGCGRTREDSLTPVEMVDDSEENAAMSGQTLCELCCLSPDIGGGWPGLTLTEMRGLWALVRREQARELANQAAREAAVTTTLHELQQSAARALEQARVNHGGNDVRKVA